MVSNASNVKPCKINSNTEFAELSAILQLLNSCNS
jgi:hypothetical protein